MDLVWIVMPGVFQDGKHHRWVEWSQPKGKQRREHMDTCKSYAPGFRLVTLESAREDYGIKVTRIVEAIGKERRT